MATRIGKERVTKYSTPSMYAAGKVPRDVMRNVSKPRDTAAFLSRMRAARKARMTSR